MSFCKKSYFKGFWPEEDQMGLKGGVSSFMKN